MHPSSLLCIYTSDVCTHTKSVHFFIMKVTYINVCNFFNNQPISIIFGVLKSSGRCASVLVENTKKKQVYQAPPKETRKRNRKFSDTSTHAHPWFSGKTFLKFQKYAMHRYEKVHFTFTLFESYFLQVFVQFEACSLCVRASFRFLLIIFEVRSRLF